MYVYSIYNVLLVLNILILCFCFLFFSLKSVLVLLTFYPYIACFINVFSIIYIFSIFSFIDILLFYPSGYYHISALVSCLLLSQLNISALLAKLHSCFSY